MSGGKGEGGSPSSRGPRPTRERMMVVVNGILAFSHLPPGSQGPKPVKAGLRHDRTPDEWGRILTGHGFSDVRVSLIDPPKGRAVGTMLVQALGA